MFSRIQTRHYRTLKGVDQELGPMQALVGPMDRANKELGLNHETLWLCTTDSSGGLVQRALFPAVRPDAPFPVVGS